MSWLPVTWAPHASETESSISTVSSGLRVAGTLLRTVFIVAMLVVTARVALPQNETIWTAYETPGDLVRMALGFMVCAWLLFQLFSVPKDAHAHRTWIYLGLAAVPFAVFCAFAIW
jgi:hypothetical protein